MKTTVATRLKELRTNYFFIITLDQLAELYYYESNQKISKQAINLWEQGERTPSFENIRIIADVFGISLDWLAGRSEEMFNKEIIENLENKISYNDLTRLLYQLPENYINIIQRRKNYSLTKRAYILFSIKLAKRNPITSKQFYDLIFYEEMY